PPDRPRDFTKMFAHVFGLSERTRARMQSRIEAQEAAHMDAFTSQRLGPQINAPMLIVHDEADNINVFLGAKRWLSANSGARLHATNGLGHRKILRDRAVVDVIADFVNAP
ncbi:MAG: alpha/beta hydrolase, partial [Casimicrobium sp.]